MPDLALCTSPKKLLSRTADSTSVKAKATRVARVLSDVGVDSSYVIAQGLSMTRSIPGCPRI